MDSEKRKRHRQSHIHHTIHRIPRLVSQNTHRLHTTNHNTRHTTHHHGNKKHPQIPKATQTNTNTKQKPQPKHNHQHQALRPRKKDQNDINLSTILDNCRQKTDTHKSRYPPSKTEKPYNTRIHFLCVSTTFQPFEVSK